VFVFGKGFLAMMVGGASNLGLLTSLGLAGTPIFRLRILAIFWRVGFSSDFLAIFWRFRHTKVPSSANLCVAGPPYPSNAGRNDSWQPHAAAKRAARIDGARWLAQGA
jgi:hypothetical protein